MTQNLQMVIEKLPCKRKEEKEMKLFLIRSAINHQVLHSGLMTPHPEPFVFICVSLLHQSAQKQANEISATAVLVYYLLLTSPALF